MYLQNKRTDVEVELELVNDRASKKQSTCLDSIENVLVKGLCVDTFEQRLDQSLKRW